MPPITIMGKTYYGVSVELDTALRNSDVILDANDMLMEKKLLSNGGWLLNGCPLNVIFDQPWLPGQRELLEELGIECTGHSAAPNVLAIPGGTPPPIGQPPYVHYAPPPDTGSGPPITYTGPVAAEFLGMSNTTLLMIGVAAFFVLPKLLKRG